MRRSTHMTDNTWLIVFMKAPVPGTTKTRLAEGIGTDAALDVYRACVERLAQMWSSLTMHVAVFVDGREHAGPVREWLSLDHVHVQEGDDLGARLKQAVAVAFARGASRTLIIGTDAPLIDDALLYAAERKLHDHDVVLGPAYDGGYYLIGVAEPLFELFDGIAWSTDRVLMQTLGIAEKRGRTCALLEPLRDIDTADDLRSVLAALPDDHPFLQRVGRHVE